MLHYTGPLIQKRLPSGDNGNPVTAFERPMLSNCIGDGSTSHQDVVSELGGIVGSRECVGRSLGSIYRTINVQDMWSEW